MGDAEDLLLGGWQATMQEAQGIPAAPSACVPTDSRHQMLDGTPTLLLIHTRSSLEVRGATNGMSCTKLLLEIKGLKFRL